MTDESLQERLTRLYRAPEAELSPRLVELARLPPADAARVREVARDRVDRLRQGARNHWSRRFLQEYGLDTEEGLALLGLAEAYLRVPDGATASALIQDKVGEGHWREHLSSAAPLPVNAATLGLVVTQALVDARGGGLARAAGRLGQPALRAATSAAIQALAEQFVLGRDIGEALRRARQAPMFRYSFDMLGEGARTRVDAVRYAEAYADAIDKVGGAQPSGAALEARDTVSVKLSALHPRYEPLQGDRAVPELTSLLVELCRRAKAAGIGLTVDAEEADRLEMSLRIIAGAAGEPSLRGWDGLGLAIQAYQRRATAVVDWAVDTAAASGRRLTARLVKGAYWDTEIKRAQEQGLASYPVFTRKAATDVSYLACAKAMLASSRLYPAFATHNALTVTTVLSWADGRRDYEFQRLHGMGEGLYEDLVADGRAQARVYAPVGGHRDLLAYLVRRMLENGANANFVSQLADEGLDEARLLADPAERLAAVGYAPHPKIPDPPAIYQPERRNSAGLDLSEAAVVRAIGDAVAEDRARAVEGDVREPADRRRAAGRMEPLGASGVRQAIDAASGAAPSWAGTTVEARAACLERCAELMERDRLSLISLAIREGGKTYADAVAEVREAVDFCRYYAVQARRELTPTPLAGVTGERNELRLEPRGLFACISPWNFPLAIFMGQVSAALVTGNAVLAKPAPQTPLIAAQAVRLLVEAGVPEAVIRLLPGGAEVGQALVADRRIGGVAFTGSTATARRIARTLLEDETRPLTPLIAETGGVNAMIVDSTALPEQVVADVVTSAFRSAGQRCSALRLLCLQEDIAPGVVEMLKGAMAELVIGDPAEASTDVGPVIDEAARTRLTDHIARRRDRLVFQSQSPPQTAHGSFVPPTLLRLQTLEELTEEVFGPVLHLVTWRAGELGRLVERINALGFGLTLGVQSRLSSVAEQVKAAARVGNLYVNRSMIGATVGVQPFGGEGLSGTGPKAGGPHYLARFCVERTLTVNTTSSGGDAALLALDD